MLKTRVGVLRGGMSSEYDLSLKTGAEILANIPKQYEKLDLFIDRTGNWHLRGMPIDPLQALNQLDVAIPALHGTYGEDGTTQKLFRSLSLPYTGSDPLGSAVTMNKVLAKERVKARGIRVPHHQVLHIGDISEQFLLDFFKSFPQPCVIKPLDSGSSIGVTFASGFDKLRDGFEKAGEESSKILVEEFIPGREVSCSIVDGYRGEDMYVFPETEIIPDKSLGHFDYDSKLEGRAQEVCPGNFNGTTKLELSRLTKLIHQELGLRDYSQMDFIVAPNGIYFLEANTIPKLLPNSRMTKSLASVGAPLGDILDHVITRALARG